MSDLEWIKEDKNLKEKYDKFKSENKVFANKYNSYEKFSEELIGPKKPEINTPPDNKDKEPEKK